LQNKSLPTWPVNEQRTTLTAAQRTVALEEQDELDRSLEKLNPIKKIQESDRRVG
jgi:hypothetical protein